MRLIVIYLLTTD